VATKVIAVIVSYNSGGMLGKAVDSLLAGSLRPDIEVVDNASSDGSVDAVRDGETYRDRVNVTVNDRNLGFARANNQVMQARRADYYLLLNPDCVVEAGTVEALVAAMRDDPAIGLAGGRLANADGSIQKTSKRRFPTPWTSLARVLGLHRAASGRQRFADFDLAAGEDGDEVEEVEAVSGAMMGVRGAALDKVGLLDEGYFMHCEDLDWCKRFHEAGYKVAYVPQARAVHFKGGSGRGPRVVWHLHRGMLRFYRKHYRRHYSAWFSGLVYLAVCVRGAALMALSVVRR